jgi:hypothetical protein
MITPDTISIKCQEAASLAEFSEHLGVAGEVIKVAIESVKEQGIEDKVSQMVITITQGRGDVKLVLKQG